MTEYIPPAWAFQLEREILQPARDRLAAARKELIAAQFAESEAFDQFKTEYDKRLKERRQ